MYAIVATSGKQYRVEPGQVILVDRIQAEEGATVELDQVLLIGGDAVTVGAPTISGAKVTAKVAGHPLGDKRITFMFKQRKRTRRKVGYRPRFTQLEIVSIDA
jgi:large subunit ribosomal protein L21